MPRLKSLSAALGLASIFLGFHLAPPAFADSGQIAIIEDDAHMLSDPAGTLAVMRKLGATVVRLNLQWSAIAPKPTSTRRPSFNDTDPGAYPAANWAHFDNVVLDAKQAGLAVDFIVTVGTPRWAETSAPPGPNPFAPPGYNPDYSWTPNVSMYNHFVQAVGKRYSGTYKPKGASQPLPRVSFWTLWNEPNFGEDLGPQSTNGSKVLTAPIMYRNLLSAGWSALQETGHGRDTILIGETAARGSEPTPPHRGAPQGDPGNFGQTRPLLFIRTLYCVNSSFSELRGAAAAAEGCPTNAAGSRAFRKNNPALFQATGFGDHPYPQNEPPNEDTDNQVDYADFTDLPNLERTLDRLQSIYGSGKRFPIYNDEFGYITDPPATNSPTGGGHYVSPANAAYYLNWSEYLSWKSSRLVSYTQYPLWDPAGPGGASYGGFAAGLFTSSGRMKPAYDAYRLPVYLPVTSTRRGGSLEVWGAVRPANFAQIDTGTPQVASLQFQRGSRGSFTTIKSVPITNEQGYFDVRVTFPASGTVRLAWTYPKVDPSFLASAAGDTVYSRSQQVTIH
jgi:hypothetical protein